jgi:hypothetical protein
MEIREMFTRWSCDADSCRISCKLSFPFRAELTSSDESTFNQWETAS